MPKKSKSMPCHLHRQGQWRRLGKTAGKAGGAGAICVCLCGVATLAEAQSVLTPMPSFSTTPLALSGFGDFTQGNGFNSILPGAVGLFQWGPVEVRPHFDYQVSYASGLQSAPGNQVSSVVQTFSPGVLFTLDTHWTLDYTPTFTYYSSGDLSDNVSHNVSLSWATTYGDWILSAQQGFSEGSQVLVQTAEQTEFESFNTQLSASYRFNGDWSIDMSVNQALSYTSSSAVLQDFIFTNGTILIGTGTFAQLQNTASWSTSDYLNYQIDPKLTLGVGVGGTYSAVSGGGGDTIQESLNGRIQWHPTTKTSISISVGGTDQQYLSGGQPSLITPTFDANLSYRAAELTTVTLDANRTISPAVFATTETTSTSLSLDVTQRLFKRLNLDVSGSFSESDYGATLNGETVDRSDTYYSISSRLTFQFLKRATASIFYTHSINNSSATGFAFDSDQAGFELGYRF